MRMPVKFGFMLLKPNIRLRASEIADDQPM
jgi:hypothetical protein